MEKMYFGKYLKQVKLGWGTATHQWDASRGERLRIAYS